jgi:hypothetical protein
MFFPFSVFCVLFVCKCVLYCCHRVSTCVLFVCKSVQYYCHRVSSQLQLKINNNNKIMFSYLRHKHKHKCTLWSSEFTQLFIPICGYFRTTANRCEERQLKFTQRPHPREFQRPHKLHKLLSLSQNTNTSFWRNMRHTNYDKNRCHDVEEQKANIIVNSPCRHEIT